MQDIIKEVYALTTLLRHDNQRLLQLIQQLSRHSSQTTPQSHQRSLDKSTRSRLIDSSIPKINKQTSLQSSTHSAHTVKNTSARHNTCQSSKSRKT